MGLATTEKRNRVAADLAGLVKQIEQAASQVTTAAQGVLTGLDALANKIEGDTDFTSADLADIEAARQTLSSTIAQVSQALAAQVNPSESSQE